jgi:hypothetical protein
MKVKIKRSTVYTTALVVLIIAVFAYSQYSKQEQAPEVQANGAATSDIVCNPPYMRHLDSCCLDKDSNSICDSDETVEESSSATDSPIHNFPPIKLNSVKIEGNDMKLNDVNGVASNQGEKIKVDLALEAEEADTNVKVEIRLSGIEEDSVVVTKNAVIENAEKGMSYPFTFYPVLPTDVRDDNFKMDVVISSDAHGKIMKTYDLNRNEPPHVILFHDFWFEPSSKVNSTDNISVMVEIENTGQREDYIRVSVSVPVLNAGAFIESDEGIDKYEKKVYEVPLYIPDNYPSTVYHCRTLKKNICDYEALIKVWFKYNENTESFLDSVWRTGPLEVTFAVE